MLNDIACTWDYFSSIVYIMCILMYFCCTPVFIVYYAAYSLQIVPDSLPLLVFWIQASSTLHPISSWKHSWPKQLGQPTQQVFDVTSSFVKLLSSPLHQQPKILFWQLLAPHMRPSKSTFQLFGTFISYKACITCSVSSLYLGYRSSWKVSRSTKHSLTLPEYTS